MRLSLAPLSSIKVGPEEGIQYRQVVPGDFYLSILPRDNSKYCNSIKTMHGSYTHLELERDTEANGLVASFPCSLPKDEKLDWV